MSADAPLVAGVELGGTKSLALIARGATVVDQLRVPTTSPEETLGRLSDALIRWGDAQHITALGIGSFGPVDLDRGSAGYGSITSTPKPGWGGTQVLHHFAERFAGPVAFDTDVAGAALAEQRWGAAAGCEVHVYLTVGTGIGGGVIVAGRPVHGLAHPELGHIRIRRAPGDGFAGVCPYHGDCIEGLASGPAIAARAGGVAPAADHPVWGAVAQDLAELCATIILTLSPERILIGGGVASGHPPLIAAIRARTLPLLNGYVAPRDAAAIERLIRPPALGERAGPLGAIALAYAALGELTAG